MQGALGRTVAAVFSGRVGKLGKLVETGRDGWWTGLAG